MNQKDRRLEIPGSLEKQLREFRGRVWRMKLSEALAIGVTSVGVAYLAVFVLDRFLDTPTSIRVGVFLAALLGCAITPWFLYRWVWSRRTPRQLARLLGRRLPGVGDQLLGVIELADNPNEQSRSPALVAAAIEQVADDTSRRDLTEATPPSRLPLWATLGAFGLAAVASVALAFPAAAKSAWERMLRPWGDAPRYTFASIEELPRRLVVAHGEGFDLPVRLSDSTEWRPEIARASIGRLRPVEASLEDNRYRFQMPPLIQADTLWVRVGDASHPVEIEPTYRPELAELSAKIELPDYLGRSDSLTRDLRGGAVSAVKGSRLTIEATAGRPLTAAEFDGSPLAPDGKRVTLPSELVEESRERLLTWVDEHGLSGIEPMRIAVSALSDEAPTLIVEGLPTQKVLLETELISFGVRARDDYGVREIGFEWRGLPGMLEEPAEGERLLTAGGPAAESLSAKGAFSAKSLGIAPQPVNVRVFIEDYYPDRGRVYSPPHLLYVLTPDQHAIWMTEQLSKWRRQAIEVRDRELRLYEKNRELRALSQMQLDLAETRAQIERQAAAELANGRRLRRLTASGRELVREASRNPEIGVGHLESWAEMLKLLDDISANRMPSVADLLNKSSRARRVASNGKKPAPQAGHVRDASAGKPGESDPKSKPKPPVPGLVDRESSQRPPNQEEPEGSPAKKKSSKGKLTLPVTTVAGAGQSSPPSPVEKKMDEAITEQEDLLDRFNEIADELNKVLANLEGSTLVKRLKAASRRQYQIAERAGDQIPDSFGAAPNRQGTAHLIEQQGESSRRVSYILDDLHAYYERRRMTRFKEVLDEMRELDVLAGLRHVSDDLEKKQGLAIAQSEYWSDSFDRWADDLVDPACSGCCPGGASPDSLPPSLVLEAMKILESEINLREETRIAEQARSGLLENEHEAEADRLGETQDALRERTVDLRRRIGELKDATKHFGKELRLLAAVEQVMGDASQILTRPDTGAPAIAAETEAIELLLRSKKINPNGGGGGGSSPGGGGGGDTDTAAIALVGSGANEKEVREHRETLQTTGESGSPLPAEYRAGLDEYFSRLEQPEDES